MRTPSLVASASTTDTGVTSQGRDDIMLSLDSIWSKRYQMNAYISSVNWLKERCMLPMYWLGRRFKF